MAEMGFSQEMKMQQSLAPQLYQSMEILQMSLIDLQQLVKQELSSNPTLELMQPQADAQIEVESGTIDAEKFDAEMENLGDDWQSDKSTVTSSDVDDKYQYMMDTLSEGPTLHEQLHEQLIMVDLSPHEKSIAELLIGNIDDDGYLQLDVDELFSHKNFPVDIFEKVLQVIQSFEPPGIGARNLGECLLLQLERMNEKDNEIYEIVHKHLDLLGRNKLEEIASIMDIPIERVVQCAEKIGRLDPKPGLNLVTDEIEIVTPEVYIDEFEGTLRVRSNTKPYPKLFLNPRYLELLKAKDTPDDTKVYIREKLSKSRLMIQSIDQRLSMIERIANEIIQYQKEYFKDGVLGLKPLNMKKIASVLDVHETTISRAVSGKYMQTPRGLIEMKYFFKPGVKTISGELISNEHAKAILADIIASEDKKKPYSDSKLVLLLKEKNISISRRTVAKYRDQLKILSSHLRRQY